MIIDSLQFLFDSFDSFEIQINDQNLTPVVKCDMGFVMM